MVKMVALRALLPLLVINSCYADSHCERDGFCQDRCSDFIGPLKPSDPSIIYKNVRGRLGNQVNGYAMLLQMKKTFGYNAFLLQDAYDTLTKVFTKECIELPILEQAFCNSPSKMKFQVFEGNFTELIVPNTVHAKGKMYNLFPPIEEQVFLPPKSVYNDKLLSDGFKTLKKTLKIQQKYVERAYATFREIAREVDKPVEKLTFVAIHNRRQDMIAFSKKAFKDKPFKKSHFYDAMEHFREEYDPVVFIYISDDMAWGRKNLKNKHKDLFFIGIR